MIRFISYRNILRASPIKFFNKALLSNVVNNGVEITIDNKKIVVPPGTTVMQAALMLGIEIPRFCYHDKLSIAGSCRMCLVEVEKMPKPIASCAMPVMNGWKIFTNSDLAKKAREGVMEFLLVNHPLDCPICDQGGECDLQDQSMASGNDRSRFTESIYSGKRAVENKDIGPLVKTIMTRCIHCTRCVRFMSEIAGVEDLGTTGRGSDMQIGTYVDKMLKSELSGNIIDVCPVGALTSMPDQFATRPWELKRYESIDVSDAVGSNILVGVRTSDVMRVTPNPNDDINEDWISDKARFSYDGLRYQRLMTPMQYKDDQFIPIDWKSALMLAAKKLVSCDKARCYGVAGQLCEAESLVALRDLMHYNNCENLYTEDYDHPNIVTGVDFRCSYTMNNTISNIENADVILLVGLCPRYEAPLLNARIRKSFIHNGLKVYVLGSEIDATYPYEYLGNDSLSLLKLVDGTHSLSSIFLQAKHPLILIGTNSAKKSYGSSLHNYLLKYSNILSSKLQDNNWKVFNIVHKNTGCINALDLGYSSNLPSLEDAQFLYLIGADSGSMANKKIPSDCFVVYQGHHGDYGAELADIILPGCAYTEKEGTYVNIEGRAQHALQCVTSPGESREDWKIIRALSDVIGRPLRYDNIEDLRKRMGEIAPHFLTPDQVHSSSFQLLAAEVNYTESIKFDSLHPSIEKLADFFMTDSISRNSKTMAKCASEVLSRF